MTDDPAADSAVVIFVLDALTSAVVDRFSGDHDLVVVIFVAMSPDHAAAGCMLAGEATVVVHAAPPSFTKSPWGNGRRYRPTSPQLRDSRVRTSRRLPVTPDGVVYAGHGPALQELLGRRRRSRSSRGAQSQWP